MCVLESLEAPESDKPCLVVDGDARSDGGELIARGVAPEGVELFKIRWFRVVVDGEGKETLDRIWEACGSRYSPTEEDANLAIRVHALPKRPGGGFGRPMEATSEKVVSLQPRAPAPVAAAPVAEAASDMDGSTFSPDSIMASPPLMPVETIR